MRRHTARQASNCGAFREAGTAARSPAGRQSSSSVYAAGFSSALLLRRRAAAEPRIVYVDGAIYEGWTLLAVIAGLTSRITLAPIHLCDSFRNPALTAKMIATLDVASDGRFILFYDYGWRRAEFAAYGFAFEDSNADGVFGAGESGIADVTVYLDANNNGTREATEAAQVTDEEGHYLFENLRPGTYLVREITPAGYLPGLTVPASGVNAVTVVPGLR